MRGERLLVCQGNCRETASGRVLCKPVYAGKAAFPLAQSRFGKSRVMPEDAEKPEWQIPNAEGKEENAK